MKPTMNFISRSLSSLKIRFKILAKLFIFLGQNKMWWLIPMILVLAVFFLIMIFAQSSPLGPFIYTLF